MSLLDSPGVTTCAALTEIFVTSYVSLSKSERALVLRNFAEKIRLADRDTDLPSPDEQEKKQ